MLIKIIYSWENKFDINSVLASLFKFNHQQIHVFHCEIKSIFELTAPVSLTFNSTTDELTG